MPGHEFYTRPFENAIDANLSDTVNLTRGVCRSLWVGGGGLLKVTMKNGDVATFYGVSTGEIRISVLRVWASVTTCTHIVALY